MSGQVLRGGVVGFGKMGMLHSAIINASDMSILCAISEHNPLVRKTLRELMPAVEIHENHLDMLSAEDLNFVFITTPTNLHVPVAIDCVKEGCHFFVEKPIATCAEEAQPLAAVLADKPVVNMVGFMMRHIDTFREARELLQRDVLGTVISFNATMYVSQLFKTGKGWRYEKKASGGGVITTQATHVIDLICWFFGAPRALNARTAAPYSKTVEDFGHVLMSWETGMFGWLDSSWSVDNHRLLETTITVHGNNGTLIVDDDFIKVFLREPVGDVSAGWTVRSKTEMFSGVSLDVGAPQFATQDEEFLQCILQGRSADSDVENACLVQRIVDCVYNSVESDGSTVLVNATA
jgi:predicted dehydrogenase